MALIRLMEKRFGTTVPAALRERVFSADLGSIETWFERALEGDGVEFVFQVNLTSSPAAPSAQHGGA
jgi:hypothetical protein